MITAVDTSVLLDVFGADESFGRLSSEAIRQGLDEGILVACDVVWSEVVAAFSSDKAANNAMYTLGVQFSAVEASAASLAGHMFARYKKGGGDRRRIVPDFLIGSHAIVSADRLLTRDRGYYRQYFHDLIVWDPSLQLGR